jgi:signal transduction histidine kinase/two-component SAPR family response regulator
MNVLIVDDQAVNQKLLHATLEAEGHTVAEAADGVEALQLLESQHTDAVISDILMPRMDGYRLCSEVRKRKEFEHLPFIHYTATYTSPSDEKLSSDLGADVFLRKPAPAEEIIGALRRVTCKGHKVRATSAIPESDVMKEYSERLVSKLEEKVEAVKAVNVRLGEEIAEHMRVENELRSAREEGRQAKEEAERANGAKDSFLANLSHELRTPLTPVLLCAAALEQEPAIAPQFRQQLGMMRRNIELEARLIDDLLDATSVSHGKFRVSVSGAIDVHSLLIHTEQIVRSDALAKPVQLHLILAANEHHVAGDAARLHQVFWNLLKNAIKFTPAGGRITVRTTNPASGQIVLTVSDTGIGIDPQTLPVIFRAFEQGKIAGSKAFGGLGIGLSISKAIVELHGGTVSAESAGPSQGALFTVNLSTVAPPPITETLATRSPRSDRQLHRLLIVEDHEPTLAVLAGLLRRHGHAVSTANSVKSALLLASSRTFDFVVSDLGLPDGDGADLMRQLSRDHGLRGIALSGYGMEQDFTRTEQAGFFAHLVKPINFEELDRTLQQFAGAAPKCNGPADDRRPSSPLANRDRARTGDLGITQSKQHSLCR